MRVTGFQQEQRKTSSQAEGEGRKAGQGRTILLTAVPWGNRTASWGPRSWTTWGRTPSSPTTSCRNGTAASSRTAPVAIWPWTSSRRSMPTSSPTETPPSSPNMSSARLTPTGTPPSTSGSSSSPWVWHPEAGWNRSCAGRSACMTWTETGTSAGKRCWR